MSLSLFSGTLAKKLKPNPREQIKSVINSEFPDDSAMLYINNGEQTFVPENLKGMVGTKYWTVIYAGEQRFQDLENTVKQLSSDMTKLEKVSIVLSKYHVQNLVCQVLLFLEGSQPEDNQGCHRFRTLKKDAKLRIEKFTEEIHINFKDFISSADALIERRNKQIHASNVEDFNERVEEVQEWFEVFPEWKNKLLFEFQLIDNWSIAVKYLPV